MFVPVAVSEVTWTTIFAQAATAGIRYFKVTFFHQVYFVNLILQVNCYFK